MNIRIGSLVFLALLLLAFGHVMAQSCFESVLAKRTDDFLAEIPAINTTLDGTTCDNSVPYFKNEIVTFQIFMQDGSREDFTVTIQNGRVTGIERGGADKPTLIMGTGECEFDTFLRSQDKIGVFAFLYLQKKIQLHGVGVMQKVMLIFVKPLMSLNFKNLQTPVDIACSSPGGEALAKKKAGEVCIHGGECESGNCLGVVDANGHLIYPIVRQCSCDPFRMVVPADGICP